MSCSRPAAALGGWLPARPGLAGRTAQVAERPGRADRPGASATGARCSAHCIGRSIGACCRRSAGRRLCGDRCRAGAIHRRCAAGLLGEDGERARRGGLQPAGAVRPVPRMRFLSRGQRGSHRRCTAGPALPGVLAVRVRVACRAGEVQRMCDHQGHLLPERRGRLGGHQGGGLRRVQDLPEDLLPRKGHPDRTRRGRPRDADPGHAGGRAGVQPGGAESAARCRG